MIKKIKIFVAGHKGMLGSAILKKLKKNKFNVIYTSPKEKLDLTDQKKVLKYFKRNRFDQIYLCAAKVGGIMANQTFPADYIFENLSIQLNVINAAFITKVQRLLFIGSTCIYPKVTKQPMKEEYLLSSKLELSNEPYAISKITGIKICESYNRQYKTDYRTVMPTNLYGVNDSYDKFKSHVIPGLIMKIYNAKINNEPFVKVWGSGKPLREFLYVDDAANLCVKIMNLNKAKLNNIVSPRQSHINIGTGKGISMRNLVKKICKVIGFKKKIIFDKSFPDGHLRKISDISKQKMLGGKIKVQLKEGIIKTYRDYLNRYSVK